MTKNDVMKACGSIERMMESRSGNLEKPLTSHSELNEVFTNFSKCCYGKTITTICQCVAYGTPIVIAESTQGIQGCWMEYFKNIGYEGKQTEYYHDNFHDWIYKEFQYKITYKDGLVFMITCGTEEGKL